MVVPKLSSLLERTGPDTLHDLPPKKHCGIRWTFSVKKIGRFILLIETALRRRRHALPLSPCHSAASKLSAHFALGEYCQTSLRSSQSSQYAGQTLAILYLCCSPCKAVFYIPGLFLESGLCDLFCWTSRLSLRYPPYLLVRYAFWSSNYTVVHTYTFFKIVKRGRSTHVVKGYYPTK